MLCRCTDIFEHIKIARLLFFETNFLSNINVAIRKSANLHRSEIQIFMFHANYLFSAPFGVSTNITVITYTALINYLILQGFQ